MTLTADDIRRITGLGQRDYYYETEDGYLQLDNRDGRCVFLRRGFCSIYEHRPEGCTLYPLIVDVESWEVALHDFCPHMDEFRFSKQQKDRVRRLVRRQEEERRMRTAGTD